MLIRHKRTLKKIDKPYLRHVRIDSTRFLEYQHSETVKSYY